jgi:hypothetical protein
VLRNTNGVHYESNYHGEPAGVGLYGRRWFLLRFGSGFSQRELQFDRQSSLLDRLLFGVGDLQD